MKRKVWVIGAVLLAGVVAAQEAKVYKPTELQVLKLQNAQKDAIIAQKDMNEAQSRFQAALTNYQRLAEEVKKENKWPEGVTFNPNTGAFDAPVAKEEKK